MNSNLDRFKDDIEKLVLTGNLLLDAMLVETYPEEKKKTPKEKLASLPVFRNAYQSWYSEALAILSLLLPTRVDDFKRYYSSGRPTKVTKDFSVLDYNISDYLLGVKATRTSGYETKTLAGPDAAIPKFMQQLEIVKALQRRLESSLFDIRAVVQADLYDNEIEAASDLNKKGFFRAAGAIAGVVLERHLHVVFANHLLAVPKKATLGLLIEELKKNDVLDIPAWRFLQHLADIRNLCDHKSDREPTKNDVMQLLEGVRKSIKTIF